MRIEDYDTIKHSLVLPAEHHIQDTESDIAAVNVKNISYDTCARLNALLKNAPVAVFVNVGGVMMRVVEVKPIPDGWIECMVNNSDESIHILVKWYTQFLLYLRKK